MLRWCAANNYTPAYPPPLDYDLFYVYVPTARKKGNEEKGGREGGGEGGIRGRGREGEGDKPNFSSEDFEVGLSEFTEFPELHLLSGDRRDGEV
jgi:hypothetical protein